MKIALTQQQIQNLKGFLDQFEDAEQLSEREYVLDLYDAEPPMTFDLTLEKDALRIEGAAVLQFDEELDGWYAAERIEDCGKIENVLRSAGAL